MKNFKEVLMDSNASKRTVNSVLHYCEEKLVKHEVSEEIAAMMIADINEFAIKPVDSSFESSIICDYFSSAYQLMKAGYSYRILHHQFSLMSSEKRPCEETPRKDLRFFVDYLRYFIAYKECPLDGYSKYIPDCEIRNKIYYRVSDYFWDYIELADNQKMELIVEQRAEELASLETEIEYGGRRFVFTVPKTVIDIVQEAKNMKCCIASRLREYCHGDWAYVFMRDSSAPDTHYADIIISRHNRQVIWAITEGHISLNGINDEVACKYYNEVVTKNLPLSIKEFANNV